MPGQFVEQQPGEAPVDRREHGVRPGENAVGGAAEFEGALGTQVVKVFDLAAARTGLRDDEARDARRTDKRGRLAYFDGFGFSVLAPEQHFPQQAPHAQAITHLQVVSATLQDVRLAAS